MDKLRSALSYFSEAAKSLIAYCPAAAAAAATTQTLCELQRAADLDQGKKKGDTKVKKLYLTTTVVDHHYVQYNTTAPDTLTQILNIFMYK